MELEKHAIHGPVRARLHSLIRRRVLCILPCTRIHATTVGQDHKYTVQLLMARCMIPIPLPHRFKQYILTQQDPTHSSMTPFLKLLTQEETITCNPTQSPTLNPTAHPTLPPTIAPTAYTSPPTMNPSESPSKTPSKTPSKQPTRSPNRPLRIINLPTHNPITLVTDALMDDEISTSSAIAYTTDHEGSNLQEMTVITSTLITAISVAVLVVLCLLIVFVYRCAFKPQKQEINTVQSIKTPPEKHRR
eukprot:477107_1